MSHQETQIRTQDEVQKALQQATGAAPPVQPKRRDRIWFGSYAVLLAVLVALRYLLDTSLFAFVGDALPIIQRIVLGGLWVVGLLTVVKIVEVYGIERVSDVVSRYNLRRIIRLLAGLGVAFIIVSILFVNWYAPIVSLGLISLILGFALQTPITSFIGWVYILLREPYRVGDRIRIGEAAGDVIEISYLDTTLWEFGGKYLSTDHPSGLIIKFPNSLVLSQSVYNYSWPLFPYIWNEIKFQVAYESDLALVAKIMQEITEKELGGEMMERVKVYQKLLAETPVDHLTVQERPVVMFRANENTWIDAIVRYLVHPKESGRVKSRLMVKLLAALNEYPDRVLFPKSNLR